MKFFFRYSHLWWNVVIQLLLGVFLEIVHLWKRIAIIYLASVVGGSLCATVLQNDTYSVGASAGVFGLVFSHLATIILNWNEMDRKFSRLFCVLLYVTYNVASPVYKQLVLKEESDVRSNTVAKFMITLSISINLLDRSCGSSGRRYNWIFSVNFGVKKFS